MMHANDPSADRRPGPFVDVNRRAFLDMVDEICRELEDTGDRSVPGSWRSLIGGGDSK